MSGRIAPKKVAPGVRRPTPPMPPALRGWSLLHLGLCGALLISCLALAATVYGELADEESAAAGVAGKRPSGAAAAASVGNTAFMLPPLETYAEVTARPLFSPNRRPAPPQLAQGRTSDAGSLVLSGIILTSDTRVALVQQGKTAPAKRLAEGQEIEGWTVQTILRDRIVLRRGASEHELKLNDDAQRAHPAAPASPNTTASTN